MMPTTSDQPSMLSAVMHAFRASHGLRTLPFDIPSMQRLARTWVGLLVSILVLALHGAAVAWPASERPRMLMDDPGSAPRGIRLMTGMFPVLSDAGEPPVVVPTDHGLFPRHMLPLDVSDSDADPVAFAMRPAAALGLSPATSQGMTGVTHSRFWPSRFLARPQLLTRLSALPAGRDLPCSRPIVRDSSARDRSGHPHARVISMQASHLGCISLLPGAAIT
jgi:hypothetical protein